MDTTLTVIFVVLALAVAWVARYVVMTNKQTKANKPGASVKDALFGKKKRSKKSARGQFWALE